MSIAESAAGSGDKLDGRLISRARPRAPHGLLLPPALLPEPLPPPAPAAARRPQGLAPRLPVLRLLPHQPRHEGPALPLLLPPVLIFFPGRPPPQAQRLPLLLGRPPRQLLSLLPQPRRPPLPLPLSPHHLQRPAPYV